MGELGRGGGSWWAQKVRRSLSWDGKGRVSAPDWGGYQRRYKEYKECSRKRSDCKMRQYIFIVTRKKESNISIFQNNSRN